MKEKRFPLTVLADILIVIIWHNFLVPDLDPVDLLGRA